MSARFKLRRGTAAAWTSANPTLALGEPGIETDTQKWKVGDGSTAWNSLGYFNTSAGVTYGTPALTLGTANTSGSTSEAIKRDSTILAFDATSPTTQAFGDSAAVGSATVAARRDHKHAMPATPVTSINKTGATALTGAVTLTGGTNVTLTQSGNDISIASTGGSSIGGSSLVYRYEVTGSDKASIDTGVDTPAAGSNDWTNGDILEVYFYSRTDDSPGFTNVNVTVNNDGSSIYDEQIIRADNATVSGGSIRAAALWVFATAGASMGSGVFGTLDMRFQNYAGTVGNKHGVVVFGIADTTAATCAAREYALGYRSTSAMTRLKFAADSTKKFKVGTQLLIYKRLAS